MSSITTATRTTPRIEIVKLPEREVPRLECQHCKYRWLYKGRSQYRVSCPRCRYAVRLEPKRQSTKQSKSRDREDDDGGAVV
jgi:hypothetical protein